MREGGGGEWEVVTSEGGGGEWEGGRVGAESVGGGGAFVSIQSSPCVTRTCRVTYTNSSSTVVHKFNKIVNMEHVYRFLKWPNHCT